MKKDEPLTNTAYLIYEEWLRRLTDRALIQLRYMIEREFRVRGLVFPSDEQGGQTQCLPANTVKATSQPALSSSIPAYSIEFKSAKGVRDGIVQSGPLSALVFILIVISDLFRLLKRGRIKNHERENLQACYGQHFSDFTYYEAWFDCVQIKHKKPCLSCHVSYLS